MIYNYMHDVYEINGLICFIKFNSIYHVGLQKSQMKVLNIIAVACTSGCHLINYTFKMHTYLIFISCYTSKLERRYLMNNVNH